MITTLIRLTVFAALALKPGAQAPQATVHAVSQAFGPRVTIHVSRPTFIWEIWSRSASVTRVTMSVDSQTVTSKYDSGEKTAFCTPDVPLSAGLHQVECRVTFDGSATFVKQWEVTVAPDAVADLPAPTAPQKRLLTCVNAKRHDLGLPDLAIDDRLDAAALAHVTYLCMNNQAGHDEAPANPGFIGQTGSIRCESFGWCTGSWEGITVGEKTLDEAVTDLFDAPYHRIPFMQPGNPSFGGSFNDTRTTLLFAVSHHADVVVSPADGQKGIPSVWVNHEEPSPLRGLTSSNLCGYPIVIAGFGPTVGTMQIASARLQTADGKSVDIWLQTPSSDDFLKNAALIIPQQPLKPGTTYVATAQITYEDISVTKTWKFTTAGG